MSSHCIDGVRVIMTDEVPWLIKRALVRDYPWLLLKKTFVLPIPIIEEIYRGVDHIPDAAWTADLHVERVG